LREQKFFLSLQTRKKYAKNQSDMAAINPAVEEYRNFVASLAKGEGVNRVFMNSDEDKALIVLVELFKSAKTIVRIFAANLCQHVGNQKDYIEALSDFIERGGEVRILINDYNRNHILQSDLYKRLAYYVSEKKPVFIRETTVKPYYANDESKKEVHFTIADSKGFRIETDTDKRTARCNFNSPEEADGVIKFFDEVFEKSAQDINLTELFGYGNQ
jgi:hypothetical protein